MTRVPLAWRNLTHNRVRFALALAGVTFAVFLMFMQYGFQNALFDSTAALPYRFNGELIITSVAKTQMAQPMPFPLARIHDARAADGVVSVEPVYVSYYALRWADFSVEEGTRRPNRRTVRAIAFRPDSHALEIPEAELHAAELRPPERVLFDRHSKDVFGETGPGTEAELGGQNVLVVGQFELGTDFTADGSVILSLEGYERLFRHPFLNPSPLTSVDFGVVRVRDPSETEMVKAQLKQMLGDDVRVQTRAELIAAEREFWRTSTPIGFAFGFGMAMGFLVGIVICYQILSSDVADHLSEYATLKAIGYSNGHLTRIVVEEALWLSLVGFIPGLIVSWVMYQVIEAKTGLPMDLLRWDRAGLILILTVVMCILSGLIAVRRVKSLDPADVF